MPPRITPYSYGDWMLIAVAVQALADLYVPNKTGEKAVALALLCVGLRFVFYIGERLSLIALKRRGVIAAAIVMAIVFAFGFWFVPDLMILIVSLAAQ
jgi:hypothetical protein